MQIGVVMPWLPQARAGRESVQPEGVTYVSGNDLLPKLPSSFHYVKPQAIANSTMVDISRAMTAALANSFMVQLSWKLIKAQRLQFQYLPLTRRTNV